MSKARKRKIILLVRRFLLSFFLLFCISGVLVYFGRSKVEKIECFINETVCDEELVNEFAEFYGQNFFLVNPARKERLLENTYPQWEKVQIKKIPFHKLLVEIKTRQPVACLKIADKIFLLDKEAVMMGGIKSNPGLLVIETETFNQEEAKKALEAAFLAEQYSLPVERVRIEEPEKLIFLFPETEAVLPLENQSSKIASLQMILSTAKIKGKLPAKIDLRFEKPVIIF
jgi:cell division septal protein FtsQ